MSKGNWYLTQLSRIVFAKDLQPKIKAMGLCDKPGKRVIHRSSIMDLYFENGLCEVQSEIRRIYQSQVVSFASFE